jgi:hypothetical protein
VDVEIEREYCRICDTRHVHPEHPMPAPSTTPDCYTVSITTDTPGRTVNKSIGVWVCVLAGGRDFNKTNKPGDKVRVSERGYVCMRGTIDSNSTCLIRVKQRASIPQPPSEATLYNFTNTHY